VLPASLCSKLWELNMQSMLALNKVGLSDDDQLILLMSYREKPEIFELHKSTWFMTLKECGGEHLTIKTLDTPNSAIFIKKMVRGIRSAYYKQKLVFKYVLRTYLNLIKRGNVN